MLWPIVSKKSENVDHESLEAQSGIWINLVYIVDISTFLIFNYAYPVCTYIWIKFYFCYNTNIIFVKYGLHKKLSCYYKKKKRIVEKKKTEKIYHLIYIF